MLDDIHAELRRVSAHQVRATLDDDFEPDVGTMLRVELDIAYWHLLPEHFLELLKELPDGAGSDEVHRAIEARAASVWHGPSPKDSRDTSP
jgi:hypothetical protein